MNSMYGSLSSPACRFFNPDVANAITYFGHAIIKLTSKKIEESGYRVIYNDTDACFVVSNAQNLDEAEAIGKKIEKSINTFYKEYVKKNYRRESYLELAFEKVFIKCLMPRIRSGEKGAKKRYAGLLLKDGKEELQFVGMEAIRGDWTNLAKKYQHELYTRIFHNQEVAEFTKKFIRDIKSGKYDNLLTYRQLETLESDIIEYVVTEQGPEPIQKIKHKFDYEHYIQKQIKPLAETVLLFFNKKFEDLLNDSSQTTLF